MAVREFAEFGAQFVAIPAKLTYDRKNERKGLGAMKRTDEQLQEELDNEIEDKSKVVNKIINAYEKEDGIEVYVTYEVLEDIGTNEKIVF